MDSSGHLVQYEIFKPYNKLLAFTTTINTLGIESVRFSDNKAKLAEVLGIPSENLVFPKQTHTNCVVEVSAIPPKTVEETDALLTNKSGICICVQTADCVPILLFDPIKKVASVVHAGWRGTVGKIVEVAVRKMTTNYGCAPENILAAIGPSISPEIYEVGDEVIEEVRKTIPSPEQTLTKDDSGKFHFNLWEANRQLLLANGLQNRNIEILGECSFLEKEKYYSARRDGIDTGRIVSGILLIT